MYIRLVIGAFRLSPSKITFQYRKKDEQHKGHHEWTLKIFETLYWIIGWSECLSKTNMKSSKCYDQT